MCHLAIDVRECEGLMVTLCLETRDVMNHTLMGNLVSLDDTNHRSLGYNTLTGGLYVLRIRHTKLHVCHTMDEMYRTLHTATLHSQPYRDIVAFPLTRNHTCPQLDIHNVTFFYSPQNQG